MSGLARNAVFASRAMLLHHALLVLAANLALTAQQYAVVPAASATLDANTGGRVAGFASRFRQQILIDRGELAAVAGTEIVGLSLRRDGQYLRGLVGGQATLRITLSSTQRLPCDASTSFVDNHGSAATVVFDGAASLPASPPLPHRDAADWSDLHAVSIAFTTGFFYRDGTLVVEIEGTPGASSSAWWPVDFVGEVAAGTTRRFGQRCGRYANLSAPSEGLRLGTTLRIAATGEPLSTGVMLVGAREFVPGVNLGFLGAPACELLVQPDIVLPTAYLAYAPDPTAPGFAGADVHFPSDLSLLRGRFFAQAIDLVVGAPGHLTATEGMELTMAALAPRGQCAIVESFVAKSGALPVHGLVTQGRMPVLRFALR